MPAKVPQGLVINYVLFCIFLLTLSLNGLWISAKLCLAAEAETRWRVGRREKGRARGTGTGEAAETIKNEMPGHIL